MWEILNIDVPAVLVLPHSTYNVEKWAGPGFLRPYYFDADRRPQIVSSTTADHYLLVLYCLIIGMLSQQSNLEGPSRPRHETTFDPLYTSTSSLACTG